MSTVYWCKKKCCKIEIANLNTPAYIPQRRGYTRKAGVFIFDPMTSRVLLVQSRGQLWGSPKGTIENEENSCMCALREVKEETGISLNPVLFTKAIRINNRATYFYAEINSETSTVSDMVTLQKIENNDVNGIGWIRLDCLEDFIKDGNIVLNQHAKITFKKFLGKTFINSNFIEVKRRRKKRDRNISFYEEENIPITE